jgi:hypothetical protein
MLFASLQFLRKVFYMDFSLFATSYMHNGEVVYVHINQPYLYILYKALHYCGDSNTKFSFNISTCMLKQPSSIVTV